MRPSSGYGCDQPLFIYFDLMLLFFRFHLTKTGDL